MITITENTNFMYGGKAVCQLACLSTDTKPTAGIANGSVCLEMDTSKIYLFDEAGAQWREWGAAEEVGE